jgi:outer membrane receptor protein involved in Fe transport
LAGYVNASADLGRWNLSAGLRAENTRLNPRSYTNPDEMQKQNYTDFFPSFNAMYTINPERGHSVSLSYSKTISRPGLENLNPYRTYSDNYAYSMGNPHLKAYYMNSLSLTGVLKNSYSLTFGLDYEDDVITHITMQDPENSEILVSMPLNIDKVIYYYAVLSIPIKFTDWWRMNTDLTGSYSINKLSDYSLTGANLRGRIANIFSFPKNFGADLTYWFRTGMVSGESRWEPKIDMLDLNVRKSFFDNKFTVNLFVENILDFPKWSSIWTTERQSVFKRVEKIHSSSFGRTYGVTLRWNFRAGKDVKVQKVVYGNTDERAR